METYEQQVRKSTGVCADLTGRPEGHAACQTADEQLVREITRAVVQQLQENGILPNGMQSAQIQDGNLARRPGAQSLAGRTRMRPKHSYEGAKKAVPGTDPKEIVIGVGAAFQTEIHTTICGIPLEEVLTEVRAGIEEEGMTSRVVKVLDTSDVCFMALQCAKLSGSGIGIGIQSKGTTVIHQKDLYPLTNLELFPQAPLMTLDTYRKIGKNAAKYVKGEMVTPIECTNDPMVRAKYQVKAALMHIIETEQLDPERGMIEWEERR
jgi:glycerol dehydratase medium subunit/propanediol dehydratase medium subunit